MNTTRRCLVVAGCLLAAAVGAAAQQEQWLSYRCGDVETACGGTEGQTLQLSDQKPADLKLPKQISDTPLFAKWKTPMVKAGFLWVVLDKSAPDAGYDRLYIDANADGNLTDEQPVASADARALQGMQSATFPKIRLSLPGPDGPITYHLTLELWLSTQERRLSAKAAGCYEGTVKVGDKKLACALYDSNANGTFNDCAEDFRLSDRIRIDGSGFAIGRVGKYVYIDNKLLALEVAADGSSVKFSPSPTVAIGTVRIGGGIERISAGGAAGLLAPLVQDGAAKLPAGKYRLNHWEKTGKDAQGVVWQLVAIAGEAKPIVFDVAADKTTDLTIGEPIVARVSIGADAASVHQFNDPSLEGRLGERIILTKNSQLPPPPQLEIRNADSTYKELFSFEFG